jgi:hypothetical protein
MSRLVALYPQTWRDRYEDEFLALLSERPPNPLDRLDIVRGAVDARLHPQIPGAPAEPEPPVARGPWPVRVGWLTLLGGVLWIAAMVVAVNGRLVVEPTQTYRDGGAALPFLFVAMMLLGAGMITLVLELPEPARAARAAAFVGSLVGLVWALAPWVFPAGLVAFGCLVIVGFAAWRAGRWSLLELGVLIAGVGFGWGLPVAYLSGLWEPPVPNPDLQFLVLATLAAAWVAVGGSLVRAPRRVPSAAPPDA